MLGRHTSPDRLMQQTLPLLLQPSYLNHASCSPMTPLDPTRRSFLKSSLALAGAAPLLEGVLQAQPAKSAGPLMAYVGTFSSPLRDVLPTQVDLPPGNGRGIHLFYVDRSTGAMTPAGVVEMGT